MKKECRYLKREQKKERGEDNQDEKETAAIAFKNGDVTIVFDDDFVGLTQLDSSWIVDSGASFHVTSRADYFSSYVHGDFGHVRMENDGVSKIVGMGDICL